MESYSKALFSLMQVELEEVMKRTSDYPFRVECCYQTAVRYWLDVQTKLAAKEFESNKEEIYFFRNIKPLFVSQIEYYDLLYYLEVFKPNNGDLFPAFLQRENSRLPRFIESNKEFYEYYKTGQTDKDENYFLRNRNVPGDISNYKPYLDPAACTSHDHLISTIITLENYQHFLDTNF